MEFGAFRVCMRFRVLWSLGFRVCSRFRVQGLEFTD